MDCRVCRVVGFRFLATRSVGDPSAVVDLTVAADQIVVADQTEATRFAVETSAPNVVQNVVPNEAGTSVRIMALTSAPNAVRVRAAAIRFLARCVAQDVTPAVRISVQFAAQFSVPHAAERAESPMAYLDVVLVVELPCLFLESQPGLVFPGVVTPPVVPLSAPVD